jgi:hypothetical protein
MWFIAVALDVVYGKRLRFSLGKCHKVLGYMHNIMTHVFWYINFTLNSIHVIKTTFTIFLSLSLSVLSKKWINILMLTWDGIWMTFKYINFCVLQFCYLLLLVKTFCIYFWKLIEANFHSEQIFLLMQQ